jgi:hypothetical protein
LHTVMLHRHALASHIIIFYHRAGRAAPIEAFTKT